MVSTFWVFRIGLIAAASWLAAGAARAQAGSDVVLPEQLFPQFAPVLSEALRQSPRMLAQNLALEAADGDLRQARSGLYPTIQANLQAVATQDRREDVPGTLSTEKFYYGLNLTQPLYHWGERRNRARIGEIERAIAARNFTEAGRLLVLELRATWLQLIVDQARLRAARFGQGRAEEALAQAEDRLARGTLSESDAFGPRLAVEQARLQADRAELTLAQTRRTFRLLTGGAGPAETAIPDDIPAVAGAQARLDALLAGFLGGGPPATASVLNLKDQVEAARLAHENARTRLRPKFNLVAGVTQDEHSYTTNLAAKYGVLSQYAGVQLQWSIFDGLAAKGAVQSSLARLRALEAGYQQTTEAVANEAQVKVRQAGFAERQMAIQERLLERDRGQLDFTREQQARGLAAAGDVARAEQAWLDSHTAALGARSAYLQAVSDFVSFIAQDPALAHLGPK